MTFKYEQNAAVLALLATIWPACFSIYEQRRRPLKIGIHHEILAALDGTVTAKSLSAALRCYVSNDVYRRRLRAGAMRIDLDGRPASEVTADEVVPAKKPKPAAEQPAAMRASAKRISLAGLLEAARLRREEAADAAIRARVAERAP